MRKILFGIFCCTMFGVEAAYFQTAVTLTPVSTSVSQNQYVAKIEIEKITDGVIESIASPTLICLEGESAEITIESEDKSRFVSVCMQVPKNPAQSGVASTILVKEENEIVLSSTSKIKLFLISLEERSTPLVA